MKKVVRYILVLCIASNIAGCSAATMAAEYSGVLKVRLEQTLDQIVEQYRFPGMTFHYVFNDGRSGTLYSGYADSEAGVPMQDSARMLGASTGKSFVGALTIALSKEGKLELDTPVSKWLGKYTWGDRLPNHESMTLRHLLTHQSGLPDHVYEKDFQQAFSRSKHTDENIFTPERLIEFILDKPPLFPVEAEWAYSDTGYILIGLVLEEVTGKPVYEQIQERFLEPLGLVDTSPANHRMLDRLAAGYVNSGNPFGLPTKTIDEKGKLHWHPGVEWTGGGLVTTSRDLARWGAALFTGKVLDDDYLSELLKAVPISPGHSASRYGAGVVINESEAFGTSYGHSGWVPGYVSFFSYYPEYELAIAFQINTEKGIVGSGNVMKIIEDRLIRLLLEHDTG